MLSLPLLITQPETCHYLPKETAQTIFVHPTYPMTTELYAQLIAKGFRRSGNDVYRANCPNCSACIPVRLPIERFQPNRNQKRCIKKNRHTSVVIKPAVFEQQHYDLYLRYQQQKHPDGNMQNSSPEDYLNFLGSRWCNTRFIEFFIEQHLVAIAVVDQFNVALSAVYTFFDPDFANYSPGVFAVLWQIDYARELHLEWLYLGYWIAECKKMSYKNQYQPLQVFSNNTWQNYPLPA